MTVVFYDAKVTVRFYYDIPNTDEHHNATDDSDEHSTSKLHFSSSFFSRNLIAVTAAENLGPEFSIKTWPVADRCKGPLEDLVSSHDIQPLPAYNEKHVLIPPFQYESTLKGALAEVHMAFYHRIKRTKWDVFNAVLRELIVLRPPAGCSDA